MNKFKLILLFIFVYFQTTNAQNDYPVLTQIVTDNAGIFSDSETLQLKEKLTNFETETTHQIVVLTIDYLGNDTIENYAVQTFNQDGNKFGQEGKDNGILILFSKIDREVRIEVGDGLTPIITDLFSSRIVRNTMIPAFKDQDYFKGIDDATSEIINIISDPVYAEEFSDTVEKEGEVSIVAKFVSSLFLTSVFFLVGFYGYQRLFIKNKKDRVGLRTFYRNNKKEFLTLFAAAVCIIIYFNAFAWYAFIGLFVFSFLSVFVVIGSQIILKLAFERITSAFESLFSVKLGIFIFPFYLPMTLMLLAAGSVFTVMPIIMGLIFIGTVFFNDFFQKIVSDTNPLYIFFGVIVVLLLFFIISATRAIQKINKSQRKSFRFSFFSVDRKLRTSSGFGGSSSGSSRSYSSSGSSSSSSSFSGGGGSSSGGGSSGSW